MRIGNGPRASAVWVVGLGLVLLTALAGTAWAQDAAVQAGAQPVQPRTNPNVVLAKPSPLPQAMTADESFAQAVEEMQSATTAHGATPEPMHLRYELKMVDVKGKPHTGSFETWTSADGHRTEIHTDTYNGVEVSKGGQLWRKEDSLRPLRVLEFMTERLMPNDVVQRALPSNDPVQKILGDTAANKKMWKENAHGVSLLCGGNGLTVKICFDAATGLVDNAAMNAETVSYEGWRKVGSRNLAGVVRVSRGKRLLVEGTLTVATNESSPDGMTVPVGAVQSKALSIARSRGLMGPCGLAVVDPSKHRMPLPGRTLMTPEVLGNGPPWEDDRGQGVSSTSKEYSGNAQVKVMVDANGKVTKATLEDADDDDFATHALSWAWASVYAPYMENGEHVGFETSICLSITTETTAFAQPQ